MGCPRWAALASFRPIRLSGSSRTGAGVVFIGIADVCACSPIVLYYQ